MDLLYNHSHFFFLSLPTVSVSPHIYCLIASFLSPSPSSPSFFPPPILPRSSHQTQTPDAHTSRGPRGHHTPRTRTRTRNTRRRAPRLPSSCDTRCAVHARSLALCWWGVRVSHLAAGFCSRLDPGVVVYDAPNATQPTQRNATQ